jgi:hypothetical protein
MGSHSRCLSAAGTPHLCINAVLHERVWYPMLMRIFVEVEEATERSEELVELAFRRISAISIAPALTFA